MTPEVSAIYEKAAQELGEYLRARFPCGNMMCGIAGRCRCNDPPLRPKDQLRGSAAEHATMPAEEDTE